MTLFTVYLIFYDNNIQEIIQVVSSAYGRVGNQPGDWKITKGLIQHT